MLTVTLLIVISVFWAVNMGASGFAVSFAPSVGSRIIKRKPAAFFFTLFVLAGALLVGPRVAHTLRSEIIAPELLTGPVVLVILFSAVLSLFLANLLKVPQSTSIIIVGSFVGAGFYFGSLNFSLIRYLILVWVVVSALAYFLTYFVARKIYPPRRKNLRFHEKSFRHESKLKKMILFTDCYSSFSIGTNNVANVAGPLLAISIAGPNTYFFFFSLLFGLGGLVLGKGVINTVGKEIVPLGTVSASLVSLVVSSFIIGCSLLGLPAPYVQFSSLSVLAVHTVKEEKNHSQTLVHPLTKKILKVWLVTPFLSMAVCYFLLLIIGVS